MAVKSATQDVTIRRGVTRLITLKLVGDEVVPDGKRISSISSVAAADKSGSQRRLGMRPPTAIAPFDSAQAKQHQEAWAKSIE